ncbi:MAG: hypothetical protein IPM69_12440 [Ignavibacteria bacterium]|nr:hypothetical protein [Ignavibacteria bacterium]
MRLKYHREIKDNEIACNLTDFQECEREAFRFVFSDINNPKNYEPVYIINPKRKTDEIQQERYHCTGYALSFFHSQLSAKKRYLTLISDKPKLYKILGTHIAQGVLEHQDGISDEPNDLGHFSHFEYENRDLSIKFRIVEAIINYND